MEQHTKEIVPKESVKIDPLKLYTKIKLLGKGATSQAWLVTDNTTTFGNSNAYYVMNIAQKTGNTYAYITQINIMRKIGSHPNVIGMIDFLEGEKEYYKILEYGKCKDLHKYLSENYLSKKKLPSKEWVKKIIRDVANGLFHLHSKGIVHGDLKPENVVVACTDIGIDEVAKIIDFDFSFDTSITPTRSEAKGTPIYMAPEIWLRSPYSYEVDIWALGIMTYILIQGKYPVYYNEDEDYDILAKEIIHISDHGLRFTSNTSLDTQEFIKTLLARSSVRPTAEEVLKLDWLQ